MSEDKDTPVMAPCVICDKPSSIEVVWPDSYVMTTCVTCAPSPKEGLTVTDAWDELRNHRTRGNN